MKQVISLLVYCFLLLGCYDADPRSIGTSLKRRTTSSYLITASEPEKDQTATENLDYDDNTEELEESTLIGSESVAHKVSRIGSTMPYNMTHHNMPVGRHLTELGRGTELTTVSENQQDTESDITATFMYDVNEMNGTEDIVTTMAFIDGNLTKSGVSWVTSEDIELINTISENPDTATYMYNANELSSAQSIQTTNSNDVIYAIEEDTTTSQTTEISSTQDLVSTLFALTSDTKTTGIEKISTTTTMGFNPEETRQYLSTSKARDASRSGTRNDVLSNVNHDTTAIDHRFTTHVRGKSMLSKVTSKLDSPATSSTTAAADRTTPSQSKPQPSMARSKAQYLSLLQSDQAVAEVESQPTEIKEVADTVKPNNPTNLTSTTKLTTTTTSISRTHSSSKTTDNTHSKNNKHISQSQPSKCKLCILLQDKAFLFVLIRKQNGLHLFGRISYIGRIRYLMGDRYPSLKLSIFSPGKKS